VGGQKPGDQMADDQMPDGQRTRQNHHLKYWSSETWAPHWILLRLEESRAGKFILLNHPDHGCLPPNPLV
jgi:hypothetical protein